MTDNNNGSNNDQMKKLIEQLNDFTKEIKDSAKTPVPVKNDIPVRKIYDGEIKENSVPVPAKPPLERKSQTQTVMHLLDLIEQK